jgi:hypothetical protein
MKKLFSHWQGLATLLAAIVLFFVSGPLLRLMDPTAGTFDPGYLQRPIVALGYHLFMNSALWVGFQLSFPSLDERLDRGDFKTWFEDGPSPTGKVWIITFILAFEALSYLVCLWLVPV